MTRVDHQLANKITLIRILGVGVIFWLTPFTQERTALWVVLIFTLIAVTDFLDGYIARKFNIESDLGKVLDPLADKILVLCLLPLLQMQVVPSTAVFIILAREFAMMALRSVSGKQGVVIAANKWGKLKTAITLPVVGFLFGQVPVEAATKLPWVLVPIKWLRDWVFTWPDIILISLLWVATAVTVLSFVTYLKSYVWQYYRGRVESDQEAKKLLCRWVPTLVTIGNLCCGVTAIFVALNNRLSLAVFFVLLGMFLDGVDGKVARKLKVESEEGAKWDSRADIVSFGVAPAVIIATYALSVDLAWSWVVGVVLGVIYLMAVRFRLRRFNESGHGNTFEGIPSPIGAALVVLPMVAFGAPYQVPVVVLGIVMSCLLMVSTLPYPHTSYALSSTYLKWMKWPSMVAFFGVLAVLAGVPLPGGQWWPVAQLLTLAPYVLFPLVQRSRG